MALVKGVDMARLILEPLYLRKTPPAPRFDALEKRWLELGPGCPIPPADVTETDQPLPDPPHFFFGSWTTPQTRLQRKFHPWLRSLPTCGKRKRTAAALGFAPREIAELMKEARLDRNNVQQSRHRAFVRADRNKRSAFQQASRAAAAPNCSQRKLHIFETTLP